MSHPFRVDGRYRNLKGAYTVESLQGSRMVIRYDDGHTETTSTTFQELALLPDEPATSGTPRAAEAANAPPARLIFTGLRTTDFQESTTGTSWRRRASLGGLLAYRLSSLSKQSFESLGVSRRNEVYVYLPHRYHQDKTLHEAKLRFKVGPKDVRHGFYVEKDSHPIDAGWDWAPSAGAQSGQVARRRRCPGGHAWTSTRVAAGPL